MSVILYHLLAGPSGIDLHDASVVVLAAVLLLSIVLLTAYLWGAFKERDRSAKPSSDGVIAARREPVPDRATRRRRTMATPSPIRAPFPNPASDRRTVLVVDDNATVIRFVERALSDTYAVKSARNGREALDSVAEAEPDLIISDVMMPVMDGHELCRKVKGDPSLRHVPIVLLTALASENDLIDGLEMGSDDYIFKPFNARVLKARVRNLIRAREEQQRLAAENDELITVSERKTELLSLAAHDLKNPLTAIRELADVLREEVGEHSDAFVPADMIHRSSDQMLQLISSLLESDAIEEGRIPIHPEALDLASLAAEVIRRNDALAERKGQTIEMGMPTGDCTVAADPHLIFEAMDNLINNAVKYAPRESTIRVSVSSQDARVRFSVTDTGPGLSEDEQQLLFQKFQRLSAQPTGGETSTGLGLSIVKQIVDLHGGTIEVRSAPKIGSTFTIELFADVTKPTVA